MTEKTAGHNRRKYVKHAYLFILLFFVTVMTGCGAGPIWTRDNPKDVLSGFLQTTESQSTETMWEYLSEGTRSKLEARAAEFNAKTENGEKRRGCDMLRAGHVLSTTREYKKLEVASNDEQEAIINIVMHDGSIIPVSLHREANRWAIDLPL